MKFFSLSYFSAGFVSILVGYSSAAALVFQAAEAAGGSPAEIASWMWALGIGLGLNCILLSLKYKTPIMLAWSTPGAALLITSLPGIPMSDAIGAFLFCSLLITICGITGWMDKVMSLVPSSLAAAVMGGVLLQFGLNAFVALETELLLVGLMVAAYLLGKLYLPKYAIPLTFLVGMIYAALGGKLQPEGFEAALTLPVFTMPSFSLPVLLGIGIPLFMVTMASQNVPGIAVLRAHGYKVPASPLMTWSGITGLILSPFGGYTYNLAAITAAITMGEDVDPDPKERYRATIWTGIFYFTLGLFGSAVTGLFILFPAELVMAIAGLALLGTIGNALKGLSEKDEEREGAMITFAITASGVTLFGIGAPFWALIFGLIIHYLFQWQRQKATAPKTV